MANTKLTLSADKELVEEAKSLADREGTSLSSMFSRFLQVVLNEQRKDQKPGPITQRATGLVRLPAKKTDRELLESALSGKHGFGK